MFSQYKPWGRATRGERGEKKKTSKRAVQEKVMVFCSSLEGRSVEWNQGRKENNFKRWLT